MQDIQAVRGPGLGPGRAGLAAAWYFVFILDILDIYWIYFWKLQLKGGLLWCGHYPKMHEMFYNCIKCYKMLLNVIKWYTFV